MAPLAPPSAPTHVHAVAASLGLRWWADAWRWLFRSGADAGVWIFMCLVAVVAGAVVQRIPLMGLVAASLLNPVIGGGLMRAAQVSALGRTPNLGDVFAGFGERGVALMVLGLLLLAGLVAIGAIMVGVGIGSFLGSFSWENPGRIFFNGDHLGEGALLSLLVGLVLLLPLSMAAWFAPALVMLRGVAPLEALRLSCAACLRNAGALTLYGIEALVLLVLALLPALLGLLVFLPLATLSTYAAFRDCFGEPEADIVLDQGFDLHL